jgi:hypothetical protein
MDNVKNLTVICQWEDGAYKCTVDMYDPWIKTWENNIPYVARRGDPAPVNVWIIEQIDTGAFNPINACPLPPPPPEPISENGPTVI